MIFKDLKRKKWGEIHKMFINICYDTKDCNVWGKRTCSFLEREGNYAFLNELHEGDRISGIYLCSKKQPWL